MTAIPSPNSTPPIGKPQRPTVHPVPLSTWYVGDLANIALNKPRSSAEFAGWNAAVTTRPGTTTPPTTCSGAGSSAPKRRPSSCRTIWSSHLVQRLCPPFRHPKHPQLSSGNFLAVDAAGRADQRAGVVRAVDCGPDSVGLRHRLNQLAHCDVFVGDHATQTAGSHRYSTYGMSCDKGLVFQTTPSKVVKTWVCGG